MGQAAPQIEVERVWVKGTVYASAMMPYDYGNNTLGIHLSNRRLSPKYLDTLSLSVPGTETPFATLTKEGQEDGFSMVIPQAGNPGGFIPGDVFLP